MRQSEREVEQLAQLTRTRRLATGLLVLMAALFVAARLLQTAYPALSFVAAFAEAAMVGALADWFAVTALFRAPLGLPIPHTAIIPRNKERIGESLAHFLKHNFITQEIIREELRSVDFAGTAAAWLAQPVNSRFVARQFIGGIPTLLRMIEDENVAQFMQSRARAVLDNMRFAPLLAEILSLVVTGGHHRLLYDHLVDVLAQTVEKNSSYIRWKIDENSPRWLPKAVDDKFFSRLLDAIRSTLSEMREGDSEWRNRFQIAIEEFIGRLRTSPEYDERIKSMMTNVLEHPLFHDYVKHLWHEVKLRVLTDATADDSQLVAKLSQAMHTLGEVLLQDKTMRGKLNQWIRIIATDALVERREMIADLVTRVIRKWDAETVSRKFELHVGKDLQYIRINGTLVGGLVGLLLHIVSLAL